MIRFAFKKGLRFIESGHRGWTILKKLATGKIQLEDDVGEIMNMEPAELNCYRLCKSAQIWRGLNVLMANSTKGTFVPFDLYRSEMRSQVRMAGLFG